MGFREFARRAFDYMAENARYMPDLSGFTPHMGYLGWLAMSESCTPNDPILDETARIINAEAARLTSGSPGDDLPPPDTPPGFPESQHY